MTTQVKPIRSFLFVPGNKESMLDKSALAKADALILDLEDSVPPAEKLAARELVARKIPALIAQGQRIWVRINRSAHIYDLDDILAVAQPGVENVVISKPWGRKMCTASSMIAEAETRANLPPGSIGLIPLLETARSMQLCYEIAQMPRVVGIVGATAKNADMGRALKFVWTPEGRETEYLKSRVVMVGAAGKQAIGGIWQQIKDLRDWPWSSAFDRQLGMSGELAPASDAGGNDQPHLYADGRGRGVLPRNDRRARRRPGARPRIGHVRRRTHRHRPRQDRARGHCAARAFDA